MPYLSLPISFTCFFVGLSDNNTTFVAYSEIIRKMNVEENFPSGESDNNATLVAYSEYQERECWKTFPHSGQSVGLILFFLTCNSQCSAERY